MEIVAARIDRPPTRGDERDVPCGKGRRTPRQGACRPFVGSEGVRRSTFGRNERGRGLLVELPTIRVIFAKTETESARERAYIRHRSRAPLGTQVL